MSATTPRPYRVEPSVEVFGDIVARYYAPILRYLVRQTGDSELAADLAQETFLDLYRDFHRLPPDRPASAWLYRIAFNNLRSERRHSAMRMHASLDAMVSMSKQSPLVPAREDENLAAVDDRTLIHKALRFLTPGLRIALHLHAAEGLTANEVAQRLGISNSAAERRISRAKHQFRLHYALLAGEGRTADL